MTNIKDRVSIQVSLSGYSFKIQDGDGSHSSGWMSADRVFTTPEFQKRYSQVDISVFTPKFALIPSQFHHPLHVRENLAEVARLEDSDKVESVDVPEFAAVLLYSNTIGETLSRVVSETVLLTDGSKSSPLPEIYFMLKALPQLPDYNKILASYRDGYLYLVIAQGRTLLLCNAFEAQDFTTCEYFIFLAMKRLQLNVEMSSVYFRTALAEEEEISLYRYFKNVEQI